MNDRSSLEDLHPHRGKRRQLSLLAIVFALVLGAWPVTTFAQIQLDGNATKADCLTQPATSCNDTDWDVINTSGGGAVAKTGLISDRPEPPFAQFTGGGSKDEQDIPNWKHRNGTPPSKDDITNAYAAAFRQAVTGDMILAFGMDRYDTSGDAQLGFWFLGQTAQPIAGGTFTKQHQNGDVLVLVNFSGGGDTPTIQVYKWDNGAPIAQTTGTVLCTAGSIPADQGFCGITNGAAVAAPWAYQNKDVTGLSPTFPPAAFFEGALNLTKLGLTGCFTDFLAESRSSTSITATLKDFAIQAVDARFNLCSIDVTKTCTQPALNTAQDRIIYQIAGTVTNTGPGTLYDVSLSDEPAADGVFQHVDCTTGSILGTFPLDSLASGASVCYKNTMTVLLTQNGLKDRMTVTSNAEPDGSGATVADTTDLVQCPNQQVTPKLYVDKDCETSVVVNPTTNQVVVKVRVYGKVCNTGDTNLTNVKVEDLGIETVNDPLFFQAGPLAAGQCKNYEGYYFPSTVDLSDPLLVQFTDTVKATATDIFNNPVPDPLGIPVTDPATCKLCR